MDTPVESAHQGRVEGLLMRGGTSRGLFVRESDLPTDDDRRDDLILELFGSPDPIQVDGIGGSHSHTSKIMIVRSSDRPTIDADYTFGQVGIADPTVDWGGNCGNLTSAIGAFAIMEGLVEATPPTADLRLYNTNTETVIEQTVPIADGEPAIYGEYAVDGIAGTGARVDSRFLDPAGGVTGALLPTGQVRESIDVDGSAYEVSIVDVANPNVFVRARDLGLAGTELPESIGSDAAVLETLERIRSVSCARIGLVEDPDDATRESPGVPFVAVVSAPQSYDCSTGARVEAADIDIAARIMSNQSPHHAYAMTGALCLAAATRLDGTVPNDVVQVRAGDHVTIGHPKGRVTVGVSITDGPDGPNVEHVSVGRTIRPLMHGSVYYRYVGSLADLRDPSDTLHHRSD